MAKPPCKRLKFAGAPTLTPTDIPIRQNTKKMKKHRSQLGRILHAGLLAAGFVLAAFTPVSVQAYSLTASHTFSSTGPAEAPLVKANDGNYYGFGDGTFYKLTPGGTYTVVASLSVYPNSLIKGSDGNLYGTTWSGGSHDYGTIFKIALDGTLTVLVEFDSGDGYSPGHLIQGSDGQFYGTTDNGGYYGYGTVFQLDSSTWTVTTLVLLSSAEGRLASSLMQASDGYLYGTAELGGTYNEGTIFRVDPSYPTMTVLAELGGEPYYHTYVPAYGANPSYLVESENGKFIGMTAAGGYFGRGVLFTYTEESGYMTQCDIGGDDYENLDGPGTGDNPNGAPVRSSDGYFYGTMKSGGYSPSDVDGGGILYRMAFNFSTSTVSYDPLVAFNSSGTVGAFPLTGLTYNGSGSFYGTTTASGHGKIFKFTP